MSDIYQAANFLTEDLDAMERAAKAAGSSSIPASLRRSLLKTLDKLMNILGDDEYPLPERHQKPSEKAIFDRLVEDVKTLNKAAREANAYSLPDGLRTELIDAMEKLLAFLKGGYGEPVHMCKPAQAQAQPEPAKREHPKTVTDRERKKSVKIKFVGKSAPAPEAKKAAPPAQLTHFSQTPVSAEKYARVVDMFGADFAQQYYTPSAVKSGAGSQSKKRRGFFQYVEPSAETLAAQARADARAAELEQRMAAEEAERRRQTAAIARIWNSAT